MHSSFSALLLPLLLLIPSVHSYPGHRQPEFKLHNILYNSSYTYSTPAHLATKYGQVSFDLTNSAVSYTTHCSAYSMREFDFFYGEITYTCDPVPDVVGSTNFTFSAVAGGALAVNQTWTCDEEGGGHGHHGNAETFLGYGTENAALDCDKNVYTNSNWTIGQIYSTTSVTCKPADLTILPSIVKV